MKSEVTPLKRRSRMLPSPDVRQSRNHKIAAPTAHRHAVARLKLLERVFPEEPSRVIVFQGPAGHGKTSFMLQALDACRQRGMLTGWLSLDETDNDVARFLGHVQEMVTDLRAEVASGMGEAAPLSRNTDIGSRTDWLVDELVSLDCPIALFIDDLHFVSSRLMLAFLRELIAAPVSGIRWFLASRVVPEIGLPRLVVGDEALIIRADELRFSQSEVSDFFRCAGNVEVSTAEVKAIHAATEGWPAGVQLYRLALDTPAVRDSLRRGRAHQPRELADYLADNVLARQEPRVQAFLLKTSLLQRMSVPLCNALLECEDSGEILSYLERTGLFVRRVESEDQWYTYHALFSRFLQDHLRAAYPDSVEDLHRRAARWHRQHRRFEEALHHFSSAGDHAEAADVFEIWADQLVPDGHMVTVDRWSDCVPIEELEKRPGLVVKIVWALSFLSRHRKLSPLLRLLRAIPPGNTAAGDPRVALSMVAIIEDDLLHTPDPVAGIDTGGAGFSRFRSFELSAVSNARGYHAMAAGRYNDALRFLARGRALSDPAGATFTWAYSIGKTALTLMSQGQLQEALTQFRGALSDPRMLSDESVSTACLACGLIQASYEAGERELAMTYFEKFREVISSAGIHDYLVIAYRAVARIQDLRGDPAAALAILEEAEQLAYVGQWPRAVRLLQWERVRRELVAGRLDRARIIAGRIGDGDGDETADREWVRLSEDSEDTVIGRTRLCIHLGQTREALKIIQVALRRAVSQTRVHRQIKLQVLAALAHRKAGNNPMAHRALDQALILAAPGGFVHALIDEGEGMSRLLLEHLRPRLQGGSHGAEIDHERFLARVISTSLPESHPRAEPPSADLIPPQGHEAPRPSAALIACGPDSLTERERKIVGMLVECMSNEQIAGALFVTRDTVKYHLKNIYPKLGVRSRLEAIRVLNRGL